MMDIKTILRNAGLILLAITAAFGCGYVAGNSSKPKERPLVKRYMTVTNQTNIYGYFTNYYRVDLPRLREITNAADLTNVRFVEITALSTNWIQATNWETLTVTQIIRVFEDYNAFWQSEFEFAQFGSNLSVALYKRAASYQIKQWWNAPRWAVMVYFPTAVSVTYNLFDDWLIGAYLTAPSNIGGVGIGVGAGVGWRF